MSSQTGRLRRRLGHDVLRQRTLRQRLQVQLERIDVDSRRKVFALEVRRLADEEEEILYRHQMSHLLAGDLEQGQHPFGERALLGRGEIAHFLRVPPIPERVPLCTGTEPSARARSQLPLRGEHWPFALQSGKPLRSGSGMPTVRPSSAAGWSSAATPATPPDALVGGAAWRVLSRHARCCRRKTLFGETGTAYVDHSSRFLAILAFPFPDQTDTAPNFPLQNETGIRYSHRREDL